eukprot:CAMPEP_0194550910 /NCGR_PEP_ID=MMETSP0253-20130528/95953_1 /TAXON_ID=2966 /ORGANISM="Noctiluca scintillans" /LENGTH=483 /DNA_ID=CAMNT_0039398361 /DNA_START=1 /DNA_END=1449 /DNA_ORIENTATION=+
MAKLVGGVYRKHLPPPAIPFSAPEGRQIFAEALADGTADIFFHLIEQFHTQAEPAMCGAATLVVVLNALRVDPGALWKGVWRWYDETNLNCCKSVEEMSKDGLEWREFLCIARCQGLKVDKGWLKLVGGVYRKRLPPPAIPFSVREGRQIFAEALADGTAEVFFPLIEQFQTQEEPAMCGPATLVVVLNALGVDPGEIWKAHWRWYHEANLNCCKSVEEMSKDGLEWREFLCIARCQGLKVDAVRADVGTLEEFEERCASVCSGSAGAVTVSLLQVSGGDVKDGLEWREFLCIARCQGLKVDAVRADVGTLEEFEERCASVCSGVAGAVTVSYTRQALGQAGDGHYSPIGAYNKRRSMVLVLDTARFKYPPHWLLVSDLWRAMRATNEQTGRSRGYAILTLPPVSTSSVHLKLSWRAWDTVLKSLATEFPAVADELTPEAELWVFVRSMPPSVAALVTVSEQTVGEPENQSCSAAVIRALRQT